MLSSLNVVSKHMLPYKSLDQRSRPTVAFTSGSRKVCGEGQDSHFNNTSNKDGSCQPATRKDALSQRPSSYHVQKEFALSFFKQLNENLKVKHPNSKEIHQQIQASSNSSLMFKSHNPLTSQNPPILNQFHDRKPVEQRIQQFVKKMDQPLGVDCQPLSTPVSSTVKHSHSKETSPASSIPSSCFTSKSHNLSNSHNPQIGHRFSDDQVDQRIHQSAKKLDQPLIRDCKLSSLTSVSSTTEEHKLFQTTQSTPGGKSLSLKRRRESSTDSQGDAKRLHKEDFQPSPVIIIDSSSSGSSTASSPPKYIKSAYLKKSSTSIITINEKPSPVSNHHGDVKPKASDGLVKQLFNDCSREPKIESSKTKTETQSSKVVISNQQKEIKSPVDGKFSYNPLRSNSYGYHDNVDLSDSSFCSTSFKQSERTSSNSLGLTGSTDTKLHNSSKLTPTAVQNGERKKSPSRKDSADFDSDLEELDLAEACAVSLSSSRSSSEEDRLLSLKEILACNARVPDTPHKTAFSEPSTPDAKVASEATRNKATSYKNTLEIMLKEKEQNQKTKELERQMLQSCKEDLSKLEEEDENSDEALSHEQKEFIQKFSVTSCAIRDIPPGEEVFLLSNFGRLFNHQTLDLKKLVVTPNNRAQQTLLQGNLEQFLLLLNAGLLRRAYSTSPCQPSVTRWLFQMMSVHPNPIISAQILQAMTMIALTAAQQIVESKNNKFEVWVPTLQDTALVFLNMGVSFVSLFPLEALQPPFNEGDLLESLEFQPDAHRDKEDTNMFPEHNFVNIIKYMALCAALCPATYTDAELLLLLTVVCRVSLETRLQLLPTEHLSCLLHRLLSNLTQWETWLPELCQTITDLSEDHHNLRRLVQLLPYSERGKQLRRHLSVAIISKLLNQRCTYKPLCTEFKLSDLRCFLPRMRPSLLLKGFMPAKTIEPKEANGCAATPDQQAYYLCYSLLALTNEASNFEFLPSKQRTELLLLSSELEKHIKCDIRESEKMLYRSKVKDFVARIYTKWQVLLQRSRPQEGKLFDYWKPLPEDEISISQDHPSIEHSKLTATEELQSKNFDSTRSEGEEEEEEEEDGLEEKAESINESNEEVESSGEEIQQSNKDHIVCKTKEQLLVSMDDTSAQEEMNVMLLDDELLGGSSEDSDLDEELIKREEELLEDDEPLSNQCMEEETQVLK